MALDIHEVGDSMPAAAGIKVPLQQGESLADALDEGVVQLLTKPALLQEASRRTSGGGSARLGSASPGLFSQIRGAPLTKTRYETKTAR